jgi:predicted amidohydrolase
MKRVKVAAVQMKVTHDPDKNIERILHWLDKAAKQKVIFACFPEACLINGWEKYQIRPIGKYIKRIQKKCREKKINCIFGSFVKEKNKIFNIIFFIDEKGDLRCRYKKIHIWKLENGHTTPGKRNNAISTKYGKIGIIDCHDSDFPELTKKLAKQGAWIIFCPSYDLKYKGDNLFLEKWEPFLRAYEDECFMISCDAYSKEVHGISNINSPLKKLKEIKYKEGMITADLDKKQIQKLRKDDFLK